MGSRRFNKVVAANILAAISTTGSTPESVAVAADLNITELDARLTGDSPFSFRELVQVGGFLHVRPAQFLTEVPA